MKFIYSLSIACHIKIFKFKKKIINKNKYNITTNIKENQEIKYIAN